MVVLPMAAGAAFEGADGLLGVDPASRCVSFEVDCYSGRGADLVNRFVTLLVADAAVATRQLVM